MTILLVEDNPGDVDLVLEVLHESFAHIRVVVARDGAEAMVILRREGRYANEPIPQLIILDLNLPRKDGREVLAEIRTAPELTHIPVIVLTTSQAESDLLHAYRLQASCYVTKPFDLQTYFSTVRAIAHFWLQVAKLPSSSPGQRV